MIDHPHQWFGGRTYSQHGDDLALLNLFKRIGIAKPSYLDIGAHHPFDLSNTALLYAKGSRGVNVEANPNLIEAFMASRPEDVNLCLAVVGEQGMGQVPFYMADANSGMNSTVLQNLNGHGVSKTISVPTMTANQIVDGYCQGVWPDILSLDAEGRDIEILESIERGKVVLPKVIVVEAVSGSGDATANLRRFFADFGFFLHSWCGHNMLYVRNEFKSKVY